MVFSLTKLCMLKATTIVYLADTDWFDPVALGMESRLIVDSQLAVSTFKDSTSGPEQARLNLNATTQSISIVSLNISAFNATMNITRNMTTLITSYVYHGGWIAAENDNDPWFQVDFRTNATVTALITQGLDSGIAWVTAYSLAYGHDRDDLQDYKVDGRIKVMFFVMFEYSLQFGWERNCKVVHEDHLKIARYPSFAMAI